MTMNFVDSLYFSIQSLLTTGFGDLAPETTAGRIVAIFYCSFGIIIFAVLLAFVRATVLESLNKAFRENEGRMLSRIMGGRWIWGRRPGESGGEEKVNEKQMMDSDGRGRTFEGAPREGGREMRKSGTRQSVGDYELAISDLRRERAREFRSQVRTSFAPFFALMES